MTLGSAGLCCSRSSGQAKAASTGARNTAMPQAPGRAYSCRTRRMRCRSTASIPTAICIASSGSFCRAAPCSRTLGARQRQGDRGRHRCGGRAARRAGRGRQPRVGPQPGVRHPARRFADAAGESAAGAGARARARGPRAVSRVRMRCAWMLRSPPTRAMASNVAGVNCHDHELVASVHVCVRR